MLLTFSTLDVLQILVIMSPPAFFPNASHVQHTGCFTHFDFDVGRLLQVIPMFLTSNALVVLHISVLISPAAGYPNVPHIQHTKCFANFSHDVASCILS
jgi:hypothetical protein